MLADLILGHENMLKSLFEFSQKAEASFQRGAIFCPNLLYNRRSLWQTWNENVDSE